MDFWQQLFSGGFSPHGYCFLWNKPLIWLHALSDGIIALSYYSIPIALGVLVRKRSDLPFGTVFLLFGAFIVACGTSHVFEIWTLWHADYLLSGFAKAVTAIISLYTALALWPLLPRIIALPSAAQLEVANRQLRSEIIERQRVEMALAESEQKYRAIFECSPLGISITDEAGNLVETNPMAERLLGVSQEDHLERTFDDGRWRMLRPDRSEMPPEEYPSVRALKEGHLVEGVQQGIERTDGSITWLLVSAVPIPIAGYGVAIGYIDLTGRVKAEQALEASERRFEAAFEAAAVGMVIATPDGVFTRANRALEAFLGYEPGELMGCTFQDITHPDDFEGGLPYRQRLLAGEIEAYQLEKRYVRKNGTFAWGQLSLSLVHSGSGAPLHFVGLIEDIDARSAAESLRRSLEEKELLLREIHHRVKNNLQVVTSLLGLQALKLGDTAAAAALADSQQRIHSIALVHEHLYRSEGLAGVEFRTYLEQLTDMLLSTYGERAGRVQLKLDIEAEPLDIDLAVPLGLVVNELVGNALKHAFPNDRTGQVRVELKATTSGGWRLAVEDDGIGFDPQTSSTPSTLGVKLVRSLARQLDAEVSWQTSPQGTRCEMQFSCRSSRSTEI
ncbi:MAG: PAS domain S-box protein [Anaerolineae bacterium]|nr:PAS domain S-box protein [Gloeobacterales cyanobacterium ES-bin-313]